MIADIPLDGKRCFMVDISGKGDGPLAPEAPLPPDVAARLEEGELEQLLEQVGGGLRTNVRRWIEELGLVITDSGGGAGGWTLGVHCTPGEAWTLDQRFTEDWSRALRAELLSIRIAAWSIRGRPGSLDPSEAS